MVYTGIPFGMRGDRDAQRLTGFLLMQVDTPAVAVVKKPNPKNVQNLKEQERLKAHLERWVPHQSFGSISFS